jgi:hypothetical protein
VCCFFSVISRLSAILWCRRQALPWIPAAASPSRARPPRACSHKTWYSYSRFRGAELLSAPSDWGDSTSLHLRHALHPLTMGHAPSRLTRIGQSQLGPIIKISKWDRGKVLTACGNTEKRTVSYQLRKRDNFGACLGVSKIAIADISFVMSVCPSGTTRLTMDRF